MTSLPSDGNYAWSITYGLPDDAPFGTPVVPDTFLSLTIKTAQPQIEPPSTPEEVCAVSHDR